MSTKEGHHPLCPYTDEEKQDVRKELGLKKSVIEDDVDSIVEWFQMQPHLAEAGVPDRHFIEGMLITAKGSREKTKKRLDNFYKYRSLAPDLIQNRREYIDSDAFKWTFYQQIVIPNLYELKRISIVQVTDPDPNNFDLEILMKDSILLGDIRIRYDYMLGDIWVLDLKNTTFGHLLRVNPVLFAKVARIFLDGYGIRLFAVHVLGAPAYAGQLHTFFSKFAKPKLMERVMFHDDVQDLYQHIPKKYLPEDYGGDQPSFKVTREKYTRLLKSEETKRFLAECSKQISDETQRPNHLFDEDYLPGTFKKLDLD